jgi:hypothetical protein
VTPIAMPLLKKAELAAAYEAVLSGWVSQVLRSLPLSGNLLPRWPHPMPARSLTARPHLPFLAVNVGAGDEPPIANSNLSCCP